MIHSLFYIPEFGASRIPVLLLVPHTRWIFIYTSCLFPRNFSLLELYRMNCSTYENKIVLFDGIGSYTYVRVCKSFLDNRKPKCMFS